MKVYEFAKEAGIDNKVVITALKENKIDVKGHMSTLTDEAHAYLLERFSVEIKAKEELDNAETETEEVVPVAHEKVVPIRKFTSGDMIPCKCVRPNKVIAVGDRTRSVYTWDGFGEIIDVDYADVQAWKSARKAYLYDPQLIIEDEDLYSIWARELDPIYENYLGLDYPEEFFEVRDDIFRKKLQNSPKPFQELIKIQAVKMINEGTFNSLSKLSIIDEVLGTDLKDFI